MPRVSVLLPCFNHESFVEEAIASALGQTLTDLELVVVDDGSTDGSWERIERAEDPRIVRHHQSNQGAHAALNKAIELASPTSEFLAILNSDDAYDPRWLEVAVGSLDARPEAGFCCALLRLDGSDQDPRMEWRRSWYQDALRRYRESGDVEASLLRANFIMTTSNVVFRRTLLESTGGFRDLRYVHDLDFFLRLADASQLALVEEELVTYRYHEANTIREAARDERLIVYEFGWILAQRVARLLSGSPAPSDLQERVLGLICSQPKPAVAAVALALLAPRTAMLPDTRANELPPLEDLLRPDHPVYAALTTAELDPRGAQVAEMEESIAKHLRVYDELTRAYAELEQGREQEVAALKETIERLESDSQALAKDNEALVRDNQALDRASQQLAAEIERLKGTRTFRMGAAISEARGLGGKVRLPGQLARIALEKRKRDEADPG